MVEHTTHSDRDLPRPFLSVEYPALPPVSDDNFGNGACTENEGFAQGQHTNYGATPVYTSTSPRATGSPFYSRFFKGRAGSKNFAVICIAVAVFLTILLSFASLKSSYDGARLKFEHEQSSMRWKWRQEKLEHESAARRWELEFVGNQSHARLIWREEELKHERATERWEMDQRDREWEAKRAKEQWAKERQQWDADQEEWEKERAKHIPYFEKPVLKDPHCRAFNTREYQARLWNIRLPGDNRWLEACMSTETSIHGRTIKSPHWCEDQGSGVIMAFWTVTDANETECSSTWGTLQDKGCFGGKRVYEAPLEGNRPGDDWYKMCHTTPGEQDLGFPNDCTQRPQGPGSMPVQIGTWKRNDPTCH